MLQPLRMTGTATRYESIVCLIHLKDSNVVVVLAVAVLVLVLVATVVAVAVVVVVVVVVVAVAVTALFSSLSLLLFGST